jgi:hypothetical protein
MKEDPQVLSEEHAGNQQNPDDILLSQIDSLVDQTIQIYELTSKESEIIEQISSSISILLRTLKVSLQIPNTIFQNDYPSIKSAILNNGGDIIILQGDGNIVTKKLRDLGSQQVLQVMNAIVPKLSENASTMKSEITERMSMLSKIVKQLKRVQTQPIKNEIQI